MKKETIEDRILQYLLNGNRINQWNSYELFQYTRLSATIFNLKARGYQIRGEWKKGQNGKKYKSYWIDTTMIQKYKFTEPKVEEEKDQEPQQTGLDLDVKKNYEWPD
jgi:hypothetical protein